MTTLTVNKPFRNLAEKFGGQVGLTEILDAKTQEILSRPVSREAMREARLKIFAPQASEKKLDIPMKIAPLKKGGL